MRLCDPVARQVRHLATIVALACIPAAPACAADAAPSGTADDLVIMSTTDSRGSFLPCGCHVPKGGLPRRAAAVDSVRALYSRTLVVDGGAVFPDLPEGRRVGTFLMQSMAKIGTSAVGVGNCDLSSGLQFLRETANEANLPLTCANLVEKSSGRTAFEASRLVRAGDVNVGVFALLAPDAERGPAADSLVITEPAHVARRTIADLRRRGATVIVLLSQLGEGATDRLAAEVHGIDVVIAGNNPATRTEGHRAGDALVAAGGAKGYFVGVTQVELDGHLHPAGSMSRAFMLGPDVRSQPEMLGRALAFEKTLPRDPPASPEKD